MQPGIEAAGVPRLKTQSPSTLGWRLRVEPRHTCRFETTFMLVTQFGLTDSRRYRGCIRPLSYVDAHALPAFAAFRDGLAI